MAVCIESDTRIPIDEPFKVSAGPGAGKTHWLICHLRNVMSHSKKLGAIRKIACITYTNVGTDTIVKRLDAKSDTVEVSTIHAFLYANVVGPYIRHLADELGLNVDDMVIVDDTNFHTIGVAQEILKENKLLWRISPDCYLAGLKDTARWFFDGSKYTDFKPSHPHKCKDEKGAYNIANKNYLLFKSWMWEKGYVSFDDILYFSSLIFERYPHVLNILAGKYPYFFIDEFQDTIPFVANLVSEMGKRGAIVGVVGDKAQSIYEFIGASAEQFDRFSVDGMKEYEIHGNRRSTKEIIDLLNAIRIDFKQDHLNGEHGIKPVLLVGERLCCYQKCLEICGNDDVQSLAFPNIIANSMRTKNGSTTERKILEEDFDHNQERSIIIKSLIKALEFARMNDLKSAWHELDIIDQDRTVTISLLRKMLNSYSKLFEGTLYDFYVFVKNELGIFDRLPKLVKGDIKAFYENTPYKDVCLSVKGADSDTKHKTIHKSKGEEFNNVFVVLGAEKDLSFITKPDLANNNTHRVYYVGVSRAIKSLFINVPSISEETLSQLAGIPINVEVVA